MEFELKAAQRKFEKEQQQRREHARKKAERDRKAREEALRRQQAVEEAQRIRRLEEVAEVEAVRLREEAALHVGGGIRFSAVLCPVQIPGEGDKILLPPSVLSQLEAQNALDKGPMFFELSLEPFERSLSEEDQESGRAEESRKGKAEIQSPVQVRPSSAARHHTNGGVLEFTAAEGFVGLPSHVLRNLGFSKSKPSDARVATDLGTAEVHVRYVRLPKATYAKLQPRGLDFAEVPNHKAVLETTLRGHSTLTAGDELVVHHGGLEYTLGVLELKPEMAVTVIETDMEVDVVPPEQGAENESRMLKPLTIGKVQEGQVDEGQYQHFKFAVDEDLAKAVASQEKSITITLETGGGQGRAAPARVAPGQSSARSEGTNAAEQDADADLYLASHPVLYPTQHNHQWSCHDLGKKTIVVSGGSSRPFPGAGGYSVGVFGFQGSAQFRLLVQIQPGSAGAQQSRGQTLGTTTQAANEAEKPGQDAGAGAGFVPCDNCRQLVPERTIALHEAYCRRHNARCEHSGCGAVLRRGEKDGHVHCARCGLAMTAGELQKHEAVVHAALTCECGAVYEMEAMVKHRTESCPLRTITCPFCGDLVKARGEAMDPRDRVRGLTLHESECGSRTAPCEQCGRAIMLKDFELHRKAVHEAMPGVAMPRPYHSPASALGRDLVSSARESLPGSGGAVQSLPAMEEGIGGLPDRDRTLSCPLCGETFRGLDSEHRLNAHLDAHFASNSAAAMEVEDGSPSGHGGWPAEDRGKGGAQGGLEAGPLPAGLMDASSSLKRSMDVACPICGTAVHSERDLSLHIDMVH